MIRIKDQIVGKNDSTIFNFRRFGKYLLKISSYFDKYGFKISPNVEIPPNLAHVRKSCPPRVSFQPQLIAICGTARAQKQKWKQRSG
jgi:hypothetical protein